MKTNFLALNRDYPIRNSIVQAEYCIVSDSDIPSGSGGINRERYSYAHLRRQPIIDEIVEGVNYPRIKQYIHECNERNSNSAFEMYKINGEYCFWGLRVGPIVQAPNQMDLRKILSQNPSTAAAVQQHVVTARMIRDITYDLLRQAIAKDCNISVKDAGHTIGNVLDCAPHEDASGYIFMVPNWAHNWFRHDGYVSKMLKELNK